MLSGATWKGAKLRVGEAKPDFRERCVFCHSSYIQRQADYIRYRITKENAVVEPADDANSTRPKKRRRLARGTQGVLASDMTLVTSENCASRSGGWVKTPMGRLVRPMRMRPVRPLPPVSTTTTVPSAKGKLRRKKKKGKEAPQTRARRTLVNPLQYGSEYLKGVCWRGGGPILPDTSKKPGEDVLQLDASEATTVTEEHEEIIDDDLKTPAHTVPLPIAPSTPASSNNAPPDDTAEPTSLSTPDFTQEAKNDLLLLNSLFGDAEDESDWGGEESLSDVDMDTRNQHNLWRGVRR